MPRLTARCVRMTVTASSTGHARPLQLGEVAFDPGDQLPDAGDLFVGGGGVSAGPVINAVDGGGEPFPGAQQVIEVGGQVREVGDVGAEVVTARAAETDRAGPAACGDVGWLGASAVGDGDLADGIAGVLGVQQRAHVPPDAVAVPVELHGGDLVDGVAAAVFPDPVVAERGVDAAMVHQVAEHVRGDPGVGVTLGVGMPVAVGHDLVLVEPGAVGKGKGGHAADPVTVTLDEACRADRPGAVGVADHGRQQGQPCGRDGREACAHPPLLAGDHAGGGAADWQPPPLAGALVVVIDQHRRAVGVEGQAVEGQPADLVGPPPGVHQQLGPGPDLLPA